MSKVCNNCGCNADPFAFNAEKKNCGCGQDPCVTYGAESFDTDKYEGHTEGEWVLDYNDWNWASNIFGKDGETIEANAILIQDAPLLLAEVKELQAWKAEVERICRTMNGPNRDTALFLMTNEAKLNAESFGAEMKDSHLTVSQRVLRAVHDQYPALYEDIEEGTQFPPEELDDTGDYDEAVDIAETMQLVRLLSADIRNASEPIKEFYDITKTYPRGVENEMYAESFGAIEMFNQDKDEFIGERDWEGFSPANFEDAQYYLFRYIHDFKRDVGAKMAMVAIYSQGIDNLEKMMDAESFGAESLMAINQNTPISNFTTNELTHSSTVQGDFNQASINSSGHQNFEVRGAEGMNTVRCNKCMWEGEEEDLVMFEDEDGFGKGCPKCETDAYLMDLEEYEAESFGAEYGKRQRFGNRYIARDTKGRIISNVSVGRSLKADRRTKSKTPARSGFGHKGDTQKGASAGFKMPTDAKSVIGIGAVLGGLLAYLESKA